VVPRQLSISWTIVDELVGVLVCWSVVDKLVTVDLAAMTVTLTAVCITDDRPWVGVRWPPRPRHTLPVEIDLKIDLLTQCVIYCNTH
jgi:hypothetical protein